MRSVKNTPTYIPFIELPVFIHSTKTEELEKLFAVTKYHEKREYSTRVTCVSMDFETNLYSLKLNQTGGQSTHPLKKNRSIRISNNYEIKKDQCDSNSLLSAVACTMVTDLVDKACDTDKPAP